MVLRNRLWGHGAYARAGLSWDVLDSKLLSLQDHPEAPRPRRVWHVARLGISPRPHAVAGGGGVGDDLVALADQYPEFAGLCEAYDSLIWKLLAPPGPDRVDRIEIQSDLLTRLGLYQSDYPLRHAGAWVMPAEPAFRPWDGDATRWLRELMQSPTLDLAAVLAGGFRDAMDRLELLEAHSYLIAARATLRGALEALDLPADLVSDIARLCDKRLLRNDWSEPFDKSYQTERRNRRKTPEGSPTPKELLHAMVAGDVIPDLYANLKSIGEFAGQAPIVPLNNQLRWFHKHRAALYARYADADYRDDFTALQTLRGDEERIPLAELSWLFGQPK